METEEMQAMEAAENMDSAQDGLVLKLKKPYRFEGQEYGEIDLTGLQKLTVQDAIDAQKKMQDVMVCETTTAFAMELAVKAAGKPIEFFHLMPRRVCRRVTEAVRGMLNAQQETENHVMRFEKPYAFEGKEYGEIDLSGLEDMTALDESAAERRMERAGFVVTETRMNYLYACIMAARVTGLPEAFFTGLPLCEALKLKNAVGDPDFFE